MYSLWDNFPTKLRTSEADTKFNGEVGFPHSEICGSKFAHNSPQLIAACHVLHRLCMPRHPPNALTSRLRVHTANVRADEPERRPKSPSHPAAATQTIWIKISACYSRTPEYSRELERRLFTASISKPIHNVKERGPKSADRPQPDLLSSFPEKVGGASRDRTDDLKLAKLALSQLSYGPKRPACRKARPTPCKHGGPRRS